MRAVAAGIPVVIGLYKSVAMVVNLDARAHYPGDS